MKRNIFFLLTFIFFGAFQAMSQTQDTIAPKPSIEIPQQTPKDILTEKGMPDASNQSATKLPETTTDVPAPAPNGDEVPVVTPPTPKQTFEEDEEEKVGSMNSNGKARKKDTVVKGKKKKKKGNTDDGQTQDDNRRK
jgi:hypothetical protein